MPDRPPIRTFPIMDTAAVVGATGLVGRRILEELSGRCATRAWVRRELPVPSAVDLHVSGAIPAVGDPFWKVDTLFVALGTTIGKAGSQAAFEEVDFDLVVECARRARDAGATTLALVSAMGADPRSQVFYNRVKGRAEAAVVELGYRRVAIARPSLLLGDRDEFRLGERIARVLMGPVRNLFPASMRPVRDVEVARSLVDATRESGWSGVRIVANPEIAAARRSSLSGPDKPDQR